jgi:hypothetical protein
MSGTNNRPRRRSVKDNATRGPSELIAIVLAENGGQMPVHKLIVEAGAKVTPERAYRFQFNSLHGADGDMDLYIRKGRDALIAATLNVMRKNDNVTIDEQEVVRPTSRMLCNFTDYMVSIIADAKLRQAGQTILAAMQDEECHNVVGLRKALRVLMATDGHDMSYDVSRGPRG